MSKNRPNQPPSFEREASGTPTPRRTSGERVRHLSLAVRLLLSLLIAFHVTAVFLAPMSIPPSSPLMVDAAQNRFMQKYLDALYINHGYHFFAPEPGPGHLMFFGVFDERGNLIRQGQFPDLEQHWPRLLYHRYFMLAEQAGMPTPDEKVHNEWLRKYMAAYARQLLREYGGQTARIKLVIHHPIESHEALKGMELTDPQKYETRLEVTQTRRDLEAASNDQSSNWGYERSDVARGWQGGAR